MHITWSYSAVKDFDNCPRKYHETRVLKRFKQGDTTATLYGTEVHKAFEELVRDGTPLPPQFARFQKFIDPLLKIKGTRYCEHKMGMTADFKPCAFFDADVWWRGIPDLLVVNEATGVARVVDYKTGKSSKYADIDQLQLLAAAIMLHYPEVQVVKGLLLFVVPGDVVKAEFNRSQLHEILARWVGEVGRIEQAHECGVWNEKRGPLCGFCPVEVCPHYKPR